MHAGFRVTKRQRVESLTAAQRQDTMRMNQPNILWICTDQQRFDTLGCTGNPLCEKRRTLTHWRRNRRISTAPLYKVPFVCPAAPVF